MKYILCVFVLFTSIVSFSQQKVLTFRDALQDVVTNYPSVKSKASLVKASDYSLSAARKDYLPELIVADQYQYSTANGLAGSYYSNGGTAISTSSGIHANNNYEGIFGSFTTLMVDWHAFDFGKVKQNVAFAKSEQQLYNADYVNEIFQQQIKAADIYLLLSLTQKLVTVEKGNVERALAFRQYVVSRAVNGLVAGVDSSYANAQVANAQLALLQSEKQVDEQKVHLGTLTGLAANNISIDTAVFLNSIPDSVLADSASVTNNPSVIFARQEVEAQQQRALTVKKSSLPTVDVLGIGWARGSGINDATDDYSSKISDGIPYQTYNYMAALALDWNITSLFKTRQQYKAAQQVAQSSQFDLDEETIKLQGEFDNAKLEYQYALQQTKLAPVQYQSAYDAYTQSDARYKAGLAALPELVQALYTLTQADVDKAVANNNVWRALLQEAAATGNLPIFLKQLP
jgi:outer membrane protein TolC